MKHLIYTIICVLCAVLFSSCDDTKPTSALPEYHGFTMTWSNPDGNPLPYVGQTVTITAAQRKLGRNLYNVNYNWEVICKINGKDSTYTHRKNAVYDYQKDDPSIRYIIPEGNDGRLHVRLRAEFDFSSSHVNMPAAYETTPGHVGSFSYQVSNTVNGKVSGNATFNISQQ